VHLVGFTIEIYYDARTYERQASKCIIKKVTAVVTVTLVPTKIRFSPHVRSNVVLVSDDTTEWYFK
jgi:hypothetical protein